MDWFDLFAVQGTLKSLLQYHDSKASVLQLSAFFLAKLSHLFETTEKTIALTVWTFVNKMISLVFNMLSRFVIAFLSRSKNLLISWLQSLLAVIFGTQENKICHCFPIFPFYLPWSDGTRCHESETEITQSCPTLWDPMYIPWNSPGRNTGVDTLSLLQGVFPTQGSNPGLSHCWWILYQLNHKGSLRILEWVAFPFSSVLPDPGIEPGQLLHCRQNLYQLSYQGSPRGFLKLLRS